eukprot:scaffold3.g6763.t1
MGRAGVELGAGVLAALRPCPHQVAGHLFESKCSAVVAGQEAQWPCTAAKQARLQPLSKPLLACQWSRPPLRRILSAAPSPCSPSAADGKAGSLVDDRGHFYKPLQQGPRGDREREFYESLAAQLAEEEGLAGAAPAAPGEGPAHADARAPLNGLSARLPQPPGWPSPFVWDGGQQEQQEAAAKQQQQQEQAVPWAKRDLRQLFPSFAASSARIGALAAAAVTQQDELGLLHLQPEGVTEGGAQGEASSELRGVGAGAGPQRAQGPAAPEAAGATEAAGAAEEAGQRQSAPRAADAAAGAPQPEPEPEPELPAGQPPGPAAEAGRVLAPAADAARKDALRRQWQALARRRQEARRRGGDATAALMYGRSPDSDEGAEATADHLMGLFVRPCPVDGVGEGEGAGAAAATAEEPSGSWHKRRSSTDLAAEPQPQREDEAAAAAAVQGRQPEQAWLPDDRQQPAQQPDGAVAAPASPRQQQQQQRSQHAPHGAAAYADPAQAQAAALLGQPAFDAHSPLVVSLAHSSSAPSPGAGIHRPGSPAASPEAAEPSSPQPERAPRREGGAPPLPASPPPLTGEREASWVGSAASMGGSSEGGSEGEGEADGASGASVYHLLPFSVRNAPLLRVVPRFYGVHEVGGRVLLELEDLARHYRHPCIMDVGFRTWYHAADPAYIQRCREKDAATTQAQLGFKICGMQVYRHTHGGYWRASKRWCKTLPEALVDKALLSFAHNERGLRPRDVYGGPRGAAAQLQGLEAWFAWQRGFAFYSSSLLIMYEGDAAGQEDAHVKVRMVDFAHTFQRRLPPGGAPRGHPPGRRDANFLRGLRAIIARLTAVSRLEAAEQLPMV